MKLVTMREENGNDKDALLFRVSEDTWQVICELLTVGCRVGVKDARLAEKKIRVERESSERVRGQNKWAMRLT